jgi:hypothetical protein
MLAALQRHPFPVDAFFERSVVLGFALPSEELEAHVPAGLELDTYADRWGFLAVAIVRTRDLRPAGFPRWLGRKFSLVGYRIFVRYRSSLGQAMRGLYIVRTETDRRIMKLNGNLFTRYNYHTADLSWDLQSDEIGIRSERSGLDVRVSMREADPPLPNGSPFENWKEARRFAAPMPYTFAPEPDGEKMVIIKGVRSNWQPRPLEVVRSEVGFFERRALSGATLANAFVVVNTPYRWEKGKIDRMPAEASAESTQ